MRTNPFGQPEAPTWLAEDPVQLIPLLLERMLEVAESVPGLYKTLPWLKEMSVWGLIQQRMSEAIFPDASPSAQETLLTTFFATVTQPIAEMIEILYVSPLMRRVSTVKEILHRMAQTMGVAPLPLDVVTGVCCFFWYRRACVLSEDPIQRQETTWQIGWRQTRVQVRCAQGIRTPFLILVVEETTGKVLAFRSTHDLPESVDLLFTLYDALVFFEP